MINDIKLSLKISLKNILKNTLSLVGIIILISLVIMIFSIIRVSENKFEYVSEKMGSNFIKINTLNPNKDRRYYLNFDDIYSLKQSNLSIKSISPEIYFKGMVTNGLSTLPCYVIGGSEDYKDFMVMDMMYGRFFSNYECVNKENVIVIDNFTSLNLFGSENSLGREVYLGDSKNLDKYKIVGIINNPSNIWRKNINVTSFCIIPINNLIYEFNHNSLFEYVYVSLNGEDIYNAPYSIINFLKVKNNVSKDIYQIENFMKQEVYINNMGNAFMKIVEIIIGVLILISGISLMNFSNLSISNRVKEIRIKKIFGANNYQIFSEFIVEYFILYILIGIISGGIGILLTYVLGIVTRVSILFNFWQIFVFLLIMGLSGLIFTFIPIIKVCKIKMIEF